MMNFKHLYYFWMVARIGGVIRASHRLHVTPQTLSGQIKLLEGRLGCSLYERDGRTIRLTEAGKIAASYADDIFTKGLELQEAIRESEAARRAALASGARSDMTSDRGPDVALAISSEMRPGMTSGIASGIASGGGSSITAGIKRETLHLPVRCDAM